VVHSTALNIEQFPFFPFILHTIITAQMKSIGGEGPVRGVAVTISVMQMQ